MPFAQSQLEEAVLRRLLPQLEAEGYQVFINPAQATLPSFLSTFRPDAVAYKGDQRIALEIAGPTRLDGSRVRSLRKLFEGHPEWELRVVYAPPPNDDRPIPVASTQTVEDHLRQVKTSIGTIGEAAALLVTWAVFEAAARSVVPDKFPGAQPTARLVEALASDGYVTPDEADMLRQIGKVRNQVAHGGLDSTPTSGQVHSLIGITEMILRSGR